MVSYQINNQTVVIENGSTSISVAFSAEHAPQLCREFVFDFDLRKFPELSALIRARDFATYWWLASVYIEMRKSVRAVQLSLF